MCSGWPLDCLPVGEPYLAAAKGREVGLHGESPRQAVIIRIGEMQKSLAVSNRDSLQLDTIIAGTQRPLLRIELDIQVFRGRRGDAIGKLDGVGLFERLRRLPADTDCQGGGRRIGRGTAVFGVDMQDQHVTPLLGAIERRTDGGKWIIDQGVDIALQVVGRFGRVEGQRPLKRVVLESFSQRRVLGVERRGGLRVRHGGKGQPRAGKRDPGEPQPP